MFLHVCMSREQEQRLKAELCQMYNLVEKDQHADTADVKVSQHLIHCLGT